MKRICFLLSIIVLGIVTASAQETITSQEEETVFITRKNRARAVRKGKCLYVSS